jgi:hypothetical protein
VTGNTICASSVSVLGARLANGYRVPIDPAFDGAAGTEFRAAIRAALPKVNVQR